MEPIVVPVTPAQDGLWWAHHRAKNRSVYNLTWRMALDRDLDRDALAVAWKSVVARHDALRTSFRQRNGQTDQLVHARVEADLHEVAWTGEGAELSSTLLDELATELHDQPFDLTQAPLARATLVRFASHWELHLSVHHIVIDGWGMQLLITHLSEAYEAARAGTAPQSATGDPPFAEHAETTRHQLAAGDWDRSIAYWRSQLDGVAASTLVPDRPRSSQSSRPGAVLREPLSPAAAQGVLSAAESAGATPFAVQIAAIHTVLSRAGAGARTAIGVATANRMTLRQQRIVGYLANLIVDVNTASPDATLADLVAQSRDRVWASLEHQHVPFPTVLVGLDEVTKDSMFDAVPITVSYLGEMGGHLCIGDAEAALQPSPSRVARTDVTISIYSTPHGFTYEFEYDADLYVRATVRQFMSDLDKTLAADQATRIDGLRIRSTARAEDGSMLASALPPQAEAADADLLGSVMGIWRSVLGGDVADPGEDFFARGGDSLDVVRLATELEQDLGVELDVAAWLADPTPHHIVQLMTGDSTQEYDPEGRHTLVTLREGGGPHLHLIPGAGSGPDAYREIAGALPAGWMVTASTGSAPDTSIAQLAESCLIEVEAAHGMPDVIGGWSMGGLVAYQIAQLARDRRGWPGATVILDPPPAGGFAEPTTAELLSRFVWEILAALDVAQATPSVLDTGSDVERTMRVISVVARDAGTEVTTAVLGQLWQRFRRQSLAAASYTCEGRLDGPVLFVTAGLPAELAAQWSSRLPPGTEQIRMDTDHHGILRAPVVSDVAQLIVRTAAVGSETVEPSGAPHRHAGDRRVAA